MTASLIIVSVLFLVPDGKKNNKSILDGEWIPIKFEYEKKEIPIADLDGMSFYFNDLTFKIIEKNDSINGILYLSASNEAKNIDFFMTDGPNAKQFAMGIYQFRGDILILAICRPKYGRPLDFTSNNYTNVIEMRRKKNTRH